MTSHQNFVDSLLDRVRKQELTIDQANVEMVRGERVRLVTTPIPQQTRAALVAAVGRGELGHVKKEGHKPEAFFHPTFAYLVAGERNAHAEKKQRAIAAALSATIAN